MKHLLIIFSLFLLVSCEQEKVEYEDLVYRDGLFYKKFSELPFTGQFKGKVNGKIVNGKRDGMWVVYDISGKLSWKGSYKNGQREGEHIRYERLGLKITEIWKNGRLIETTAP